MKEIIRLDKNARGSRIVIYSGVAYLGGTTADDPTLDIAGQTDQVLQKIDSLLENAGTDKSRLLSAQIWLKEIGRDFAGMNEVWDAWLPETGGPTRATCQASMASPGKLIEIIVTAATDRGGEAGCSSAE
jgi:enamine deaminase RidA (YjgF/YER057c/UK114 family)